MCLPPVYAIFEYYGINQRVLPCEDNLVNIAATKISAGVSTGIGEHVEEIENKGDDQFEISDGRSVEEVYEALLDEGLQPVMNDYVYV